MAKKKFDVTKLGTKALGLGAGAVASRYVSKIPGLSTLDPKITAAAKIAIGIVGPDFIAPKSDLVASVGDGMAAVGMMELAGAFIPGIAGTGDVFLDEVDLGDDEYLNGWEDGDGDFLEEGVSGTASTDEVSL